MSKLLGFQVDGMELSDDDADAWIRLAAATRNAVSFLMMQSGWPRRMTDGISGKPAVSSAETSASISGSTAATAPREEHAAATAWRSPLREMDSPDAEANVTDGSLSPEGREAKRTSGETELLTVTGAAGSDKRRPVTASTPVVGSSVDSELVATAAIGPGVGFTAAAAFTSSEDADTDGMEMDVMTMSAQESQRKKPESISTVARATRHASQIDRVCR